MTVINPSSISGITSFTMPSGDGNVLTIHTNDGTERFRIDSSGNVKVGSACTISQDGDVFFTGVCTATTLAGSGANLTALPAANLTGILPALNAASLTSIPAANIVGVCTSGLTKTGGFGGITQADQWGITANLDTSDSFLTNNWERNDANFDYVGDGMSESSGVFTFPETGIYLIIAFFRAHGLGSTASYVGCDIHCTTNNSDYTNRGDSYDSQAFTNGYCAGTAQCFFDVTDTSTHKIKLYIAAGASMRFSGGTNKNETGLTFIRLGDT